jgi:hypothetical protein
MRVVPAPAARLSVHKEFRFPGYLPAPASAQTSSVAMQIHVNADCGTMGVIGPLRC